MRARLFSKVGETKGAEFEIENEATIGRHPKNEIVIEPSLVSSRHARIFHDPESGRFVLEDLGSLNGTALDGHPVLGRERLGHRHAITFTGKHDFIFLDVERCAERHGPARVAAAATDSTIIEEIQVALPGVLAAGTADGAGKETGEGFDSTRIDRAPVSVPEILSARAERKEPPETVHLERPEARTPPAEREPAERGPKKFFLELVGEGGLVDRFLLREGENLLGRGVDAHIQPDSLDISHRHAMITVAAGRVTVHDLGSRNRTCLEDEEIDGEVDVPPGSRLFFGGVEATLESGED